MALYIFLSVIFLITPIFFIELGRPKDLIKAGLILFTGSCILIERNLINYSFLSLLIIITIVILFLLFEIATNRWNQLSDNEQNKLKTPSEYLQLLYILRDSINLGLKKLFSLQFFGQFQKKKSSQKKWVRLGDGDKIANEIEDNQISSKNSVKTENLSKEDIIGFK